MQGNLITWELINGIPLFDFLLWSAGFMNVMIILIYSAKLKRFQRMQMVGYALFVFVSLLNLLTPRPLAFKLFNLLLLISASAFFIWIRKWART